jgi:acetoin utilization deacetylase AcuC-like enzyme
MRIVYDALYGDHLRGIGHIESPDRVEVVAAHLAARGMFADPLTARDATDADLLRVHAPAYLELVKREGALPPHAAPRYLSTGDVAIDERSLAVARRAAGGAIAAVQAAVRERAPVFALVRPPGHHAEAARGMGFCLFNNAAIAARAYLAEHGGRALIVDFDYHHGNGTQAVAGGDLSYISTHAYPAYPGTGSSSVAVPGGEVVNIPLPASGVSTEAFVATWEQALPELARRIRPTLLVVSAGFDYVAGDPVGDLGVDVEAATHLASTINATAAEHDAHLAYVLEGGYDIEALTESVAQVIAASDTRRTQSSGADPRSSLAG